MAMSIRLGYLHHVFEVTVFMKKKKGIKLNLTRIKNGMKKNKNTAKNLNRSKYARYRILYSCGSLMNKTNL